VDRVRFVALLGVAACDPTDDHAGEGSDSRELVMTVTSPQGRRAELSYVSGGGAAGYVFYELTVEATPVAHVRRKPDVQWLGEAFIRLRGCFDDYDRAGLQRDIAVGLQRGIVVTYDVCP
jgi:hypothetical protein